MTGSVRRLDAAGIMKRLRDSGCLQPDDADPQGAEFARPLTAEAFHRVECDSSAAHLGEGLARRRGSYRHDDARSARDHLSRGGSRGQEFRPYGGGYRPRKVFEGHFEQRAAVNITMTDRVEGDIQAAHLPTDGCGVFFHLAFVQRIDLGHLCDAAQA